MNNAELKTHFYKRFNSEGSTLVFAQSGLPVALMGRLDFDVMPSISCCLSMRVRAIVGRIGSRSVTITSTGSDMRRVYELDRADSRDRISRVIKRAEGLNLLGAELLTDSNIPPAFDPHITYTSAVCKAILEISGCAVPDAERARLCAADNEKSAYITEFVSESGYCVYNNGVKFMRLPLPMTGCKFIIAAVKETSGLLSSKNIQKTYAALKKIFPHIASFDDITDEMLETSALILKSYSMKTCARHLVSECKRTKAAARLLRGCNIKGFAELMNESFLSQKHLCADNDPGVFLCDELYAQNGVLGVRMCEQGVIALVREENCDSILTDVSMTYEREFGSPPVLCVADTV
ncbi:MAG: hypothetical protein LUD03_03685 [Firmicutes bacterium]|nr:hypothetical protein [Bacillota bacterium]